MCLMTSGGGEEGNPYGELLTGQEESIGRNSLYNKAERRRISNLIDDLNFIASLPYFERSE